MKYYLQSAILVIVIIIAAALYLLSHIVFAIHTALDAAKENLLEWVENHLA